MNIKNYKTKNETAKEPHYEIVVFLTAAETKIKEIVFNDVTSGVPEQETKQTVYRVIRIAASKIKDGKTARESELRLAKAFRRWYRTVYAQVSAVVLAGTGKATATLRQPAKVAAESYMLRLAPKARNVATTQRIGSPLVSEYRKKMKGAFKKIAARLAAQSAARGISVRNLAEMEARRQATADDIQSMKSSGVRLVWVSSHANCSERCSPWQGRLYSIDGTSGETDGYKYIPIDVAINVPQYTKSGAVYMNGLFGFNCRHHMIPYTPHSVPPVEYSANEIERERKTDFAQRRMENAIRRQKEKGFILRKSDYESALKAWEKARELERVYEDFCRNNNRTIYRERTRVMIEEVDALKI